MQLWKSYLSLPLLAMESPTSRQLKSSNSLYSSQLNLLLLSLPFFSPRATLCIACREISLKTALETSPFFWKFAAQALPSLSNGNSPWTPQPLSGIFPPLSFFSYLSLFFLKISLTACSESSCQHPLSLPRRHHLSHFMQLVVLFVPEDTLPSFQKILCHLSNFHWFLKCSADSLASIPELTRGHLRW